MHEIIRHSLNQPWTYALLDAKQRNVADEIQEGKSKGLWILSELAPVITLGNRIRSDHPRLQHVTLPLFETDRGGCETYHGPGQWVFFPVMKLEDLVGNPKGVRQAVEFLLKAALNVSMKYRNDVSLVLGDQAGLWTSKGKLASVGLKIKQGIILHGISLNVFWTPESFAGINPCGLEAKPDTLFSQDKTATLQEKDFLFQEVGELFLSELTTLWGVYRFKSSSYSVSFGA